MNTSLTAKPAAFIVAGTHSGVGKTTVTLTLLKAIVGEGFSVQPFKLGPDFIDTVYHKEAARRPSINLDLWMMGAENVRQSFQRFSSDVDIALIESMGALYDGEDGTERGSAAQLAKLLDVPVILVIDIWGMTRSAVPLLRGFLSFDESLSFAGFVMNRAGSPRHVEMVYDALPEELRKICLGYILHRETLKIPERHLGLITPEENEVEASTRLSALDTAKSGLRIESLLPSRKITNTIPGMGIVSNAERVRIAIARDRAFCFYYLENLSLLEEAGAELCPFSPIADPLLPAGIAGVYIGGGYPESFVDALESNVSLNEQLRTMAKRGLPIYAECGGFMYLGRTLTGFDGRAASMAGIFPVDTVMDPQHLAIRYVTVRTTTNSPLGPAGTEARGQEFHQSRILGTSSGQPVYDIIATNGDRSREGLISAGAVGSYIHLHFASNREVPPNFVQSCKAWARRQLD